MAVEVEYGAQPVIKVGGTDLATDLEVVLEQTVVEDHLHLPDMFELRFRDDLHDVLGRAGVEIGKEMEISATPTGRDTSALPLCMGEITAIETEYEAATGTHTVVRGYDVSHRLMKQTHTRAWEQTTITDVVREVLRGTPVTLGTVSGEMRYEYVAQCNESDWSFLQRLARETGLELTVDLGELHFRAPPESAGAPREGDLRMDSQPLQVVLGSNLQAMRVRVTAAGQTANAVVRSWDYVAKRTLVGRAAATQTPSVQAGVALSDVVGSFSPTDVVACNRPFGSEQQVTAAARSLAELIAASHAEAYGVVTGNPSLKAGKAISISNVGSQFEGKYVVTSSRHVFDEEGFATHFDITGRHERSILGLTSADGADSGRIPGVVVGVVTNVRDPDALGRVKLKFPWLDDDLESAWARVTMLDAGSSDRGTLVIPEVGDEVLVAFEHGDFRRPYVLGSLWNGKDKAPVTDDLLDGTTGQINRREYRSRLGHVVVFADDASTRSGIEIRTADGKRLVHLDEKGGKLLIEVQRSTVEITDTGDLKIDASANVSIRAAANLEIEAANVKINGSGQTEIKGGMVRIN